MVITKRYNSVERFTSMELMQNGSGAGEIRPGQLAIQPPAWTPVSGQPAQHISLQRRRSNEQLLQPAVPSPTGTPARSTPHSLSIGPQQGMVQPSPSFFQPMPPQQQQFIRQPQQQQQPLQQRPMPQPRSIMRPASQPTGPYPGVYGGVQAGQPSQVQYIQPQQRQVMQMPSPRSGRQSAPPQNFSDVYSQSHTDAELAENMRSYFARKVPAPIWLSLSAMQIVAGLVSLFIGAFHAAYYHCLIQPNIPIYLIISGILLIINGGIRIFFWLISSTNTASQRKRAARAQRKYSRETQYRHLCEYALDGTVLFGILVIVILGCIWVYGVQRYMPYSSSSYYSSYYDSNNRYCNPTVYWTAWWSVTLHLGFFALLILGAIVLLIYGAFIG